MGGAIDGGGFGVGVGRVGGEAGCVYGGARHGVVGCVKWAVSAVGEEL